MNINYLSGTITLPLFKALCGYRPVTSIRLAYGALEYLLDQNKTEEAFETISFLISLSQIEVPEEYAEIATDPRYKTAFVGEFLADLEDILNEFR